MKIGVVIPYYKAPQSLERCLASLDEQEIDYQLFVRDNSRDNILYTRAVNEGLSRFAFTSGFKATLVLTQDVILRPECVSHMLKAIVNDSNVGICCPVSVGMDDAVNFAGGAHAYPWGRHIVRPLHKMPSHPYSIYWANGACLLINNEMVRSIGTMDDNMRFVCSDADYSFTARARGWKVLLHPLAIIEHELAASKKASPEIAEIKQLDRMYFKMKWIGSGLYESLRYPESDSVK